MVSAKEEAARDKFDGILQEMQRTKQKLLDEAADNSDDDDEGPDGILQQAISLAIEQGKGWKPGEKEAYLEKILDDDFIPPLFATSVEEVEKSGLQEAFTSLIYNDETPTALMLQFKNKGKEAFANGKRNVAKNMQYYRDAVNHWYEAFAWAQKIEPLQEGDYAQADTDDPTYNERELDQLKATILGNVALAHLNLKNWGLVRDECQKALKFDSTENVKIWYRLAKAYQMLKDFEGAGDAIDGALKIEPENKDVLKLQQLLAANIRKARQLRQQRERVRAERVSQVKAVWKHCNDTNTGSITTDGKTKSNKILLGRVPLVATVTDDEDPEDIYGENADHMESRWHNHLPHTGMLPTSSTSTNHNNNDDKNGKWSWPCMFLYPTHNQSDFIKDFGEDEMIALRMAQVFPELDEDNGITETAMPWDYNNEFVCSQLAVYFEVHAEALEKAKNNNNNNNKKEKTTVIHPESVDWIPDQASCMRFYESSRALKGDEGPEIANVIRAVERKHLYKQRKAWKKVHKSLWCKPDPCSVVRVHPAMTLRDVLTDHRMVVPNFLVTFFMIPENHPLHEKFLEEHKCVGVLQPAST